MDKFEKKQLMHYYKFKITTKTIFLSDTPIFIWDKILSVYRTCH